MREFLLQHNAGMLKVFDDKAWMIKPVYLSDFFGKLNTLNLSLQGQNSTVFTLKSKVQGFLLKLEIRMERVKSGNFEMFSATDDYLTENAMDTCDFQQLVYNHLTQLKDNLLKSFSTELTSTDCDWILTHLKIVCVPAFL